MRTSSTKVIALFILLIALAVGGVERGALSLIHISEPTRPY